jgi:hypothetical protein
MVSYPVRFVENSFYVGATVDINSDPDTDLDETCAWKPKTRLHP